MHGRRPRVAPAARGNRIASGRPAGADLVDGGQPGVEAVPGGAQVQPPDARALGARDRLSLVEVLVQPLGPVAQRRRIVLSEALDVLAVEAGPLQRRLHARTRTRLPSGDTE